MLPLALLGILSVSSDVAAAIGGRSINDTVMQPSMRMQAMSSRGAFLDEPVRMQLGDVDVDRPIARRRLRQLGHARLIHICSTVRLRTELIAKPSVRAKGVGRNQAARQSGETP